MTLGVRGRLVVRAGALALALILDGSLGVRASCADARAVSSSMRRGASYLYTPGQPFAPHAVEYVTPSGGTTTYYIRGVFWGFGAGDPRDGLGVDSGGFPGAHAVLTKRESWLNPVYYPDKAFLGGPYGHWQFPGVDGCISRLGGDPALPDKDECLVVMLSDFAEPSGYFAVLSTSMEPAGNFFFTEKYGFPKRIDLSNVPVPRVASSQRDGKQLNLDVRVEAGAVEFGKRGMYLKCHDKDVLQGYRIYARRFPAVGKIPAGFGSRALEPLDYPKMPKYPGWERLTRDPVPIGKSAQLTVACAPNEDLVLAATLTFGGTSPGAEGYELRYVSADSERIRCVTEPGAGESGGRKAP